MKASESTPEVHPQGGLRRGGWRPAERFSWLTWSSEVRSGCFASVGLDLDTLHGRAPLARGDVGERPAPDLAPALPLEEAHHPALGEAHEGKRHVEARELAHDDVL